MTRLLYLALAAGLAFGQPKFEIADVHPSAPGPTAFMRGPLRHGVRFELLNASMVDLVAFAYGVGSEKVVGGPSWVEYDRFDVIGQVPPSTQAEALKTMVQSLLAERFKLTVHSDTKPFPGYALTAGKNVKLKDADGSGQTGCQMRVMMNGPPPGDGGASGPPDVTFTDSCHSVTMQIFAESLSSWVGTQTMNGSSTPVMDKTELKGAYDLDLKFNTNMGDMSEATVISALDKQFGLKLETVQVPMQVITADSANRKPTPNSPEVAKAFPPPPIEFEVASLKPSDPTPADAGRGGRGGRGAVYQNDRVTMQNSTLHQLINLAWGSATARNTIVDVPKFADTDRYDLMAKVPASVAMVGQTGGGRGPVDLDLYRPMLQKLLTDRFQMKVHFEDRPVDAYVLTAVKPKLQKADPAKRTKWEDGPPPDAKDPRKNNPVVGRLVYCQNMNMAEFAALLPGIAPGYQLGQVEDKTGLEGSWDFSVNFSPAGFDGGRGGAVQFVGGGVAVRAGGGGDSGTASDPSGGISLFDAISKQLGLKLELQKRPAPVLVIDHMEQKPTEN